MAGVLEPEPPELEPLELPEPLELLELPEPLDDEFVELPEEPESDDELDVVVALLSVFFSAAVPEPPDFSRESVR